MNELELHNRLSGLADDLTPDVDPHAQAAGARSLHRRQRRTRIGVTGAVAAVTALVIGVPAAVNTLSAPEGGDVAAPSTTETTPPALTGEADLRDLAERVRTELADVTAPDLSSSERAQVSERPCPDASDLLSDRVGLPLSVERRTDPPAATLGGRCSWSSDLDQEGQPTERLDLSLWRPGPRVAVRIMRPDAAPEGCFATTLPDKAPPNSSVTYLWLCRPDADQADDTSEGQVTWDAYLPDGTGEGWVLTVAVGESLPARTGVDAILALRDVVQDELTPPTDTDDAAVEMAARIAARYPEMSAVPVVTDPFCPATSEELRRAGAGDQPTGSLIDGCVWTADVRDSASSVPATGSIRLTSDPILDAISCPTAAVPGWSPGAELRGCPVDYFTAWTLVIPTYDGSGAWVVTASGGVHPIPDGEGTTLEYVGPSSGDLLTMLVRLVQTR